MYKYSIRENTFEFHYPGSKYTGPGTHVLTKILNNEFPVNRNDALTMIHDIEYIMYQQESKLIYNSDQQAINESDYSLHGLLIKAGLSIKNILGLDFHSSSVVPPIAGFLLKRYIQNDPLWTNVLADFRVKFISD